MSQSNSVAGLSQPHSNQSSLHYYRCWWAWCHHNFYTRQDLLDHLTSEHVQKAHPELLQDVAAHKTAEDDSWGPLETPSCSLVTQPSIIPSEATPTEEETHSRALVPLSPPSPPTSALREVPSSVGTPPSLVRQSWYQPPHHCRSSKNQMPDSFTGQAAEIPTIPLNTATVTLPNSNPELSHFKPTTTPYTSPSIHNSQLQSESDSTTRLDGTQTDDLSPTSYPQLQTQAPYYSQTMSQD